MVELDKIQGHLVLLCKGHYKVKEGEFFEGLKRIWAVRCGYDYNPNQTGVLSYIADYMFDIITQCCPNRLPYLQGIIHKELSNQSSYKPENMTPIEAIIWEYRSILCNLQVKEKVGDDYVTLVMLPKPMKRIFNRILRGGGRYDDYNLINNDYKIKVG